MNSKMPASSPPAAHRCIFAFSKHSICMGFLEAETAMSANTRSTLATELLSVPSVGRLHFKPTNAVCKPIIGLRCRRMFSQGRRSVQFRCDPLYSIFIEVESMPIAKRWAARLPLRPPSKSGDGPSRESKRRRPIGLRSNASNRCHDVQTNLPSKSRCRPLSVGDHHVERVL